MGGPEGIKISEIIATAELTFETPNDLIPLILRLDAILLEHWRKKQ